MIESYAKESVSYDNALSGLEIYGDFYSLEVELALEEINKLKESKSCFELAEQEYFVENYKIAYDSYLKVIETDINYSVANQRIEECYTFIVEQIMSKCDTAIADGDYLKAADILESELEFLSAEDLENANIKIAEYKAQYIDDNIKQMDEYMLAKDYVSCFEVLEFLQNNIGENERIIEKREELYDAYEKDVEEEINTYLETRDLVTCMQLLSEGKQYVSTSERFMELETMLQEYYPVSLYEMEPFAIGDFALGDDDTKEDLMGTMQRNVLTGYHSADLEQYDVYHIDGKYNTLKATVAVSKGSMGTKKNGSIRIYGDDLLLWEDTNLSGASESYEIDVNITGVDKLKIEMCGPKSSMGHGITVMLCDPIIQK